MNIRRLLHPNGCSSAAPVAALAVTVEGLVMAQMFKRSEDGAIVCADCLAPEEELTAAALQPRHFPGTYHRLHCARCGAPGAADPLIPRAQARGGGRP